MEEEHQPAPAAKKVGKQHNTLPFCGNEISMNLNPLILANIQGSSYFKVHLFKLKTYHEVVDEIYYQVKHMEPWERGSRKTSGQTGMCGGVRGVGAGGIVSTAYCLLYKLYTLRLTRKQVNGLLNHTDSPYIRALGFMYLRYTQPPADLYDWYENYLQDVEPIDVKAGGGQTITIGQMLYQFLTKLDWFSTLFPRIPVPIQKQIEKKLELYCRNNQISMHQLTTARLPTHGGDSNQYDDNAYDRRGGSGGIGSGSGAGTGAGPGGSASGTNDAYFNRDQPPATSYRTEHDDRDYYNQPKSSQQYNRRRDYEDNYEDESRSYRDRDRERYREKHKRKHKHRSRSRSHSRSGHPYRSSKRNERSDYRERDREKDYDYYDRAGDTAGSSSSSRAKDKNEDRRYR